MEIIDLKYGGNAARVTAGRALWRIDIMEIGVPIVVGKRLSQEKQI